MSRDKKIAVGMSIYFLVCTVAMIWPGAVVANRIEPIILGLPFLFFWYVAWVFMVFVGTLVLYRLEYGEKK
ncbi:MAG TPA: hypothetical protein VHG70_03450 [Nocardioidaceae bacterium]|jgi:hypothetical protein|nr:hypothetical protein [Nocardioidaceae bacterium]